jgi:hypothetical protein
MKNIDALKNNKTGRLTDLNTNKSMLDLKSQIIEFLDSAKTAISPDDSQQQQQQQKEPEISHKNQYKNVLF